MNAFSRGDDGAGLLPLQHRGRNLLRIGHVAETRLEDFDAGLFQPLLDLLLQMVGDCGRRSSEGDDVILV